MRHSSLSCQPLEKMLLFQKKVAQHSSDFGY